LAHVSKITQFSIFFGCSRKPHAPLNGKQMLKSAIRMPHAACHIPQMPPAPMFVSKFFNLLHKMLGFQFWQATKAKEIVSICHDNFFEKYA